MFSCETYEIFKNTQSEACERLKPALSLGMPFLISCSFGCQFSLHCYWSCFNQKQSSGGALRKRCSNKFRKFYKKTLDLRLNFDEVADLQSLTLKKKEILAQMFFCEFSEICHKTFFKEPFGRLLLHKHSFRLFSKLDLVPFQKRCHIYFSAEYFLGLICRLGPRMSSIFQTLS